MNLEEQILSAHSKANTDLIVNHIGDDPDKFANLMALFFRGSYRLTQRTAWAVSGCVHHHPQLIYPHLRQFIDKLEDQDIHDGVKRNSLKVLEAIDVPLAYYGKLISLCFNFLENKKEPVAVKVFAMSILFKLTRNEADLQRELRVLIEDQLPYASAGFKSRGSKILKAIQNRLVNQPT